jgi:hypothetical protein
MKPSSYAIISGTCLVLGALIYAYLQGWIIIHGHLYTNLEQSKELQKTVSKKKVKLTGWNYDRWNIEDTVLIAPSDKQQALYYLVTRWLSFLYEEHLIHKKVMLQTVLLSSNGHDAYLSFDKNILSKEWSTHQKWMVIEGLLKTLRDNGMAVTQVTFLVNHKPLNDAHLDFSNPWPTTGFLNQP